MDGLAGNLAKTFVPWMLASQAALVGIMGLLLR